MESSQKVSIGRDGKKLNQGNYEENKKEERKRERKKLNEREGKEAIEKMKMRREGC